MVSGYGNVVEDRAVRDVSGSGDRNEDEDEDEDKDEDERWASWEEFTSWWRRFFRLV